MSDLLFEYKVRYRYKTGYKEFSFYATTEIEEFLNRNNIEYVRNVTDTVEYKLFKEIERLNNIINELERWLRSEIKRIEELQNPAKSKVKPYGEEYNNYTLIIGAYDNVLDKLQELKGSSNNE